MADFLNHLKRLLQKSGEDPTKEEPTIVVTLRHRAEKGDAQAQFQLGDMYYNGEEVPQDYTMAATWYRRAAEQGNTAAQFQLGNMYRVGLGMLQSMTEATQWLNRAAEQGDVAAQALLAKLANQIPSISPDFLKAVKSLHCAAEQGEAGAQFLLGIMYETGNGVARDPVAAFAWNEQALKRFKSGPLREESLRRHHQLTAALTLEDQARARILLRHEVDESPTPSPDRQ